MDRSATRSLARVAALSESGNAFCIQHSGATLAYGKASGDFGAVPGLSVLRAAIRDCGSAS